MPPVFGPASPSSRRLKSCGGHQRQHRRPSVTRTATPPGRRGTPRPRPRPRRRARAPCATATARSSVTTTPLPAASPSSLTTYGAPELVERGSSSAAADHPRARGRHARGGHHVLGEGLEPSSCAASADGPKHGIPASRTASATPATSGTSGPMTTRSARHARATAATAAGSAASTAGSATARVPGLPGRGERAHRGVGGQSHAQGVLPGTGTDHQHAHGNRI